MQVRKIARERSLYLHRNTHARYVEPRKEVEARDTLSHSFVYNTIQNMCPFFIPLWKYHKYVVLLFKSSLISNFENLGTFEYRLYEFYSVPCFSNANSNTNAPAYFVNFLSHDNYEIYLLEF